ncbi:unnamed protein product [Medioppia subpectinata]|uniref:CUB domain-containing protein n=1 Tax=Medioppia subpectinata TaxID=1979941 RepID=A0A7R9L2L9_9ACAR|nr:unnamed protein product [Medioppia subpectinata]CAG2114154.1 unnamed protein product [Medioppia subpectinata]
MVLTLVRNLDLISMALIQELVKRGVHYRCLGPIHRRAVGSRAQHRLLAILRQYAGVLNLDCFRNPNAPSPYTESRACSVSVQRLRPDVCQLRLDFLVFDMSRPRDGTCDSDRFVVNGQTQNSIIPPVCGYNTGQHMYIDMSSTNSPVTLNVLTMGNRNRLFDIRVTQIHCSSGYRAPANCLQYHIGVQGSIRSFNYDEPNVAQQGGYLNNLDYTICFKKEPGFCTVTYSVPTVYVHINDPNQSQEGPLTIPPGRYFNIIPDTSTSNPVGNDQAQKKPHWAMIPTGSLKAG